MEDFSSILDFNHRRRINKSFFQMLPQCLNIQQAMGLKGFGGPIFQSPEATIYVCKVNTGKRHKYRIPFAPFLDNYIVLTYDTRDNLDYTELAREALVRYREANEQNAYVQLPSYQQPLSYR